MDGTENTATYSTGIFGVFVRAVELVEQLKGGVDGDETTHASGRVVGSSYLREDASLLPFRGRLQLGSDLLLFNHKIAAPPIIGRLQQDDETTLLVDVGVDWEVLHAASSLVVGNISKLAPMLVEAKVIVKGAQRVFNEKLDVYRDNMDSNKPQAAEALFDATAVLESGWTLIRALRDSIQKLVFEDSDAMGIQFGRAAEVLRSASGEMRSKKAGKEVEVLAGEFELAATTMKATWDLCMDFEGHRNMMELVYVNVAGYLFQLLTGPEPHMDDWCQAYESSIFVSDGLADGFIDDVMKFAARRFQALHTGAHEEDAAADAIKA